MSTSTLAIRPLVEIIDGQALTNSFKIAQRFEKRHDIVLRAIENLECSSDFRDRNFAETSAHVPMPRGGYRQIPAYSITRDGFAFLGMGFTGAKAAQWKEAYIAEFNRMEAVLREQLLSHSEQLPVTPLLLTGDSHQLSGQRYLVSVSDDGQSYSAKPIDSSCCVMTPQAFLQAIADPNGILFGVDDVGLLFDAVAALQRSLRARHAYWAGRG